MAHFANLSAFERNNEKEVVLLQKASYRWNKRLTQISAESKNSNDDLYKSRKHSKVKLFSLNQQLLLKHPLVVQRVLLYKLSFCRHV